MNMGVDGGLEIIVALLVGFGISPILIRCIQRMPADQPLWSPPLQCRACQTSLPVISYLPVLGYFLALRKCHSCQHPLPIQSWLAELMALLGTLSLFLWHGFSASLWVDLLFLYSLIVVTWIDWNELIIEPRVVVIAIVFRIAWVGIFDLPQLIHYLASMLVAAGAFYFIGFFYETLRNRQGLGEGDAAVLGMIALWTGWQDLPLVILIAALSGLLVGGGILFLKKLPLGSTQVPFAPFLCFGGALMYSLQLVIGESVVLRIFLP